MTFQATDFTDSEQESTEYKARIDGNFALLSNAALMASLSFAASNAGKVLQVASGGGALVLLGLGEGAALDKASQAQAEAGTLDTVLMTPLRTAQAIAALGGSADQTARDMAASAQVTALLGLEAAAGTIPASFGAFLGVDTFNSDSLATASNATYNAATDAYDTYATVSCEGDASLSSSDSATALSKLVDNDAGVVWYTGTDDTFTIDFDFSTAIEVVGFSMTAPNDSTSARTPNDFTIYGSDTGAFAGEETTLLDVSGISWSNGETKSWDLTTTGSYRYYRFGGDGKAASLGQTNEFFIAELTMTKRVVSNVTLVSDAVTLDTADPTDVVGYFVIDPTESITMGTDVIGKFSIDGGSTWGTGSWSYVGPAGDAGRELWRLDVDTSGQAGSSAKWQINTANSKKLSVAEHVGFVPLY